MTNYATRPQSAPLNLTYQIEWEKAYQKLLIKFLKTNRHFDGSAVAAWMRKNGLHDPTHHNMWGAQITYYAGLGWFRKTGYAIPTGNAHIARVAAWRSESYETPKRILALRLKRDVLIAAKLPVPEKIWYALEEYRMRFGEHGEPA